MRLVYTNDNSALVGLAKSLLENSGVDVMLKNEFTASHMAPPYNIDQELWVIHDEDFDQAVKILNGMNEEEVQ